MKLFDIDWAEFLDRLPAWSGLSVPARRAFLKLKPSQAAPATLVGRQLQALLKAELVASVSNGTRVAIEKPFRLFAQAMRAMGRYRLHDSPAPRALAVYAADNFTNEECSALEGMRGYRYAYDWRQLVARVSSVEWLSRFLAVRNPKDWEGRQQRPARQAYFSLRGSLAATQRLVRTFMDLRAPVPFGKLPDHVGGVDGKLLAACILAGIRYFLLFPALRSDGLDPVIGVWPGISERLGRPARKRPAEVTPSETFHSAFLMEDMTTVLVTCSAEPLRLRANDGALFKKARGHIESNLIPLPGWLERVVDLKPGTRVELALAVLLMLGFVGVDKEDGRRPLLRPDPHGAAWLSLPAKGRLKGVIDGLISRRENAGYGYDWRSRRRDVPLFPFDWNIESDYTSGKVAAWLAEAFLPLKAGRFVPVADFIAYGAEQANPLVRLKEKGLHLSISHGWSSFDPTHEETEDLWGGALSDFIALRLVPLGGARLGLVDDGSIAFAFTKTGRYLLGEKGDFDYDVDEEGEIVVQPNFEVVFLSRSPHAEAEIGRFARRAGKGVGVLFKITQESVFAAAGAGLTADGAIETLRRLAAKDVPANVEREVCGWFGRCRRVSINPAVLIRCPDAETAARVIAAAGGRKLVPVSDTVLELQDTARKADLLRRLRAQGLFVDLQQRSAVVE